MMFTFVVDFPTVNVKGGQKQICLGNWSGYSVGVMDFANSVYITLPSVPKQERVWLRTSL